MLPVTGRYVMVCEDLGACAQNWIHTADGLQYERLATWLAEQETNDYLKVGTCTECGDMVFSTEDRFSYSGGRAALHMECFIKRLNASVWSNVHAIRNNQSPYQHQNDQTTP